jgi:hypothetical protein
MIDAAHQRDGRPERAHSPQVRFPIGNARIEHGSEQRILADLCIERAHQTIDHRVVDAGLGGDFGGHRGAALGRVHATL